MAEREVWVVMDADGNVMHAFETQERAKSYARERPCRSIGRYIPEPTKIDGWPEVQGYYWYACPDCSTTKPGCGPEVVLMMGDGRDTHVLMAMDLNGIHMDWLDRKAGCFWGPLLPPRVWVR